MKISSSRKRTKRSTRLRNSTTKNENTRPQRFRLPSRRIGSPVKENDFLKLKELLKGTQAEESKKETLGGYRNKMISEKKRPSLKVKVFNQKQVEFEENEPEIRRSTRKLVPNKRYNSPSLMACVIPSTIQPSISNDLISKSAANKKVQHQGQSNLKQNLPSSSSFLSRHYTSTKSFFRRSKRLHMPSKRIGMPVTFTKSSQEDRGSASRQTFRRQQKYLTRRVKQPRNSGTRVQNFRGRGRAISSTSTSLYRGKRSVSRVNRKSIEKRPRKSLRPSVSMRRIKLAKEDESTDEKIQIELHLAVLKDFAHKQVMKVEELKSKNRCLIQQQKEMRKEIERLEAKLVRNSSVDNHTGVCTVEYESRKIENWMLSC